MPKQSQSSDDNRIAISLSAFANNRKSFGSCVKSEIYYRAFYILIACKKRNIGFELILFVKPEDSIFKNDKILKTIYCN